MKVQSHFVFSCYWQSQPEKVEIAMHCNLRPPGLTTVDLRVNYEARAPAYQILTQSGHQQLSY